MKAPPLTSNDRELHSHVFEHAPVAIAVAGLEETYRTANPQFCALFGYSVEELVQMSATDLIREDYRERGRWQIAQIFQGLTYPEEEMVFCKKDGTEFWCVVETSCLYDGNGELEGIIGYFKDVTEKRQQEIALRHAKQVVDEVSEMVTVVDQSGKIVMANPAANRMKGDKVEGTYVWDHDETITRETWPERWERLATEKSGLILNEIRLLNGEKRTLENAITISEHKGDLVNIGIARDVTDRLKKERRMRRAMFSVDNGRDPIYWTTTEGILLYMNCAAQHLVDYEFKEVIGQHVSVIVPDETTDAWGVRLQRVKHEGYASLENELKNKMGVRIPVVTSIHFMEMDGDEMVIWQSRDSRPRLAQLKDIAVRELKFKSLFELAPAGVAVTNPEGFIEECNPWFASMMGYSTRELVGQSIFKVFDSRDYPVAFDFVERVKQGQVSTGEMRFERQDKSIFWGRFVGRMVEDEDQKITQIFGMITDLSEERRARRAQLQAQYCLKQSKDAIAIIREDSSYEFVNPAYSELMGIPEASFDALRVVDIDPEVTPEWWAEHWVEMSKEESLRSHHKLHLDDGSYKYLEVVKSFSTFEGESMIMSSSRDITERYHAMRELSRARHCLEVAADPIAWTNEHGEYIYVNPAFSELYEHDDDELLGKNVLDLDPEMTSEGWRIHWQELKESGNVTMEVQLQMGRNAAIPMELSANYFELDGTGYNFAFFRDLRSRIETERKLRDSESMFRALFEGSPVGKGMTDGNQQLVKTNRKLQEMLGYSASELSAMKVSDLIHPDSADFHEKHYEKITTEESVTSAEVKYVRKDGSSFWGRRWAMRLLDEQGNVKLTMGSLLDVDVEYKAKQALLESEENFRTLFEESPFGIFQGTAEGRIVHGNRIWRQMLGYQEHEVDGLGFKDIVPTGDEERRRAILKKAMQGEVVHSTSGFKRRDGSVLTAKATALALFDENGKPKWLIGMLEDIEQTRKSEALVQRQMELERSNKDLEQFVYIASHDLREPLRSMRTLGEMIHKDYYSGMEETGQRALDFMIDASTRMDGLIRGLLDYSRLGSEEQVETVNLSTMMSQVQDDFQVAIQEESATIFSEGLPEIQAFAGGLRILLQNLVGNAIKFHAPDEKPQVTVTCLNNSGFWQLSVRDNGIGIAPEHVDKIFYIFRRLHGTEDFEGSGIGLAHCKRIAELHGGKIWVESEVGKGSTFHVSISKFL